jgi:predicted esterase
MARLLCPRGNGAPSRGTGFIGPLYEKRVSLDHLLPVRVQGATLAGFSIGAQFALQLAVAEPGTWTGLVLMSNNMAIPLEDLKRAGARRLVLAAGESDGSYPRLQSEAKKLAAAGFPVRFVSLGPVGHHFAKDMDARMVDAIGWVRGG